MARGEAYATAVEYRGVVGSSDTSEDGEIDRQLLATSRYVERYTGQFFGRDAEPEARVFIGSGLPYLRVDWDSPGIATATGLVVKVDADDDRDFTSETDIASSLLTLPLNAAVNGRPIHTITYASGFSGSSRFAADRLVEVTAVWGWPAVPADIKEVVIRITGIWRGDLPGSTQRFNELEQVVQESPYSMSLIKKFLAARRRVAVG